jgi:protease I
MSEKILIVVGDGGESYETWYAKHRFEEAGYQAVVAAPQKRRLNLVRHDFEPGWDTYKEGAGYAMEADISFDRVDPTDYVAVLCIGGRSPEYLRNSPVVLQLLKAFDELGKWHFSICHGLQLTAAAGLASGKTVTCYEHVRLDVERFGAKYVDRPAVRDGRIVSARTWNDHPAFYREVFNCLERRL